MRRFVVRFSESEASNHTPSLADFTTNTSELKFSVHTPGLKWRKRKRGPDVPYWFADPEAIKAGYPVKSTNLNEYVDRPKILVDRAERLQSEMLRWMSGERKRELCFDGSFKSLIDIY